MARAFIVLNRNDLGDSLLQVLDLKPHSSQFSPAYDGQNSGQSGYQTHMAGDAAVNTTVATQAGAGGGASLDVNGDSYGLAAYLLDNVEDQVANAAITAAVANATRDAIFDLVSAGSAITAAAVANALVANGVSNAGAGTTLTAGNSTGVLEEVLRILAGEVWKLPDNSQVTTAAGAFDATVRGFFVTRPNVETPDSVDGTYGAVRGRKFSSPLPFIRPGETRAGSAPVQAGTQDTLFRDVRTIVDTGDLHLSAQSGVLADLKLATYTFENPSFTYGTAGTALTLGGGHIGANFQARAVVVYDADGNVI